MEVLSISTALATVRGRGALRALVLAAVALAIAMLGACGEEPPPDAATVNGARITDRDMARAVGLAKLAGTVLSRNEALDQLIAEELVVQEAKRLGLLATADQVEERLAELADQVGGVDALKAGLRSVGLTPADLRASLHAILLGESVQQAKFPGKAATAEEARQYYEENLEQFTSPEAVRLGDIVVRAEGVALNVIQRIESGQSFGNAARQFSVDPELRANEGMLGWISLPSLPKPLREAVGDMEIGELSDPVEVGIRQWHVLKLFGRRPAATPTFEKVGPDIRERLTAERQGRALQEWVREERRQAEVVIL